MPGPVLRAEKTVVNKMDKLSLLMRSTASRRQVINNLISPIEDKQENLPKESSEKVSLGVVMFEQGSEGWQII